MRDIPVATPIEINPPWGASGVEFLVGCKFSPSNFCEVWSIVHTQSYTIEHTNDKEAIVPNNTNSNTNDQNVVNTAELKEVYDQTTGKKVTEKVYYPNLKVSNNGSLFSKPFPREITYDQLVAIKAQKPKIKLDKDTMENKESYVINASKTQEFKTNTDGEELAPKDYWKQAYYYPKRVNSLDFVL